MKKIYLLLVTILFPLASNGQKTTRLSFDDAIKLALENNANVKVQSLERKVAKKVIYQNLALGLPSISVGQNYTDNIETLDVLNQLIEKGYTPLALELTNSSITLRDFKITNKKPIALFIGNEKTGISTRVLEQIHTHLHIPMYGNNSSMNVTQAAAVGLYALLEKTNYI